MSNIQRTYQLTADDRTLVVMPLFHVHGLIGALLSTLVCLVLFPDYINVNDDGIPSI